MRLAQVQGSVVCTIKDPGMEGIKLLLIQPIEPDGSKSGPIIVATDSIGAGAGETVFWCKSKEAVIPFLPKEVPTDACVIGIIDSIYLEK